MQITETTKDGLKRGYDIVITAGELTDKIDAKLKEARPDIEMKGFRKGKVPMHLLQKQFGKRLMGEAMQESIDGAIADHFEKSGERPALQPDVKVTNEQWKEGEDVQVSFSYEALPKIPDVDLKSIKLEKMVVSADAKSVDEALKNLAETSPDYKERAKTAKAKKDDQVVLDFVGRVDGETFEGGSAEDYPLILGSNSFIPGFEDQLVDVKTGDALDVKVTFPEEYGAKPLAGKDAVFQCTIKAVKAPKAAKIDDEFAKKFGAEDLKSLKEQVKERLETEYKGAARALQKRDLLDNLDKMVDFDLPPTLVDTEAKQIAHQLWHEENPDVKGHDHPEIETKEEHITLAKRRVKLGLLLADLGQEAKVTVSEAEMNQAIMQQASQYRGHEREFFEFIQKNEQMQQQLRAPIFEDKVVDYIFELAKVSTKKVSQDEMQKALDALDEE